MRYVKKPKYNTGGQIGSAIGSTATSFIPGVGPMLAPIGGMIGGFIGKELYKEKQPEMPKNIAYSNMGYKYGGKVKPIGKGAKKYVGPKHEDGGILIDENGNPATTNQAIAEVEGGETEQNGYIFSDTLIVPETDMTFADVHEMLIAEGAPQQQIDELAAMQEQMNGGSTETTMQDGGKLDKEKYLQFKEILKESRQAYGKNDTKKLAELGLSELYNSSHLARDFSKAQELRKKADLGIVEEASILLPHVGQQVRGTLNRWFKTNYGDGGNLPKYVTGGKTPSRIFYNGVDGTRAGRIFYQPKGGNLVKYKPSIGNFLTRSSGLTRFAKPALNTLSSIGRIGAGPLALGTTIGLTAGEEIAGQTIYDAYSGWRTSVDNRNQSQANLLDVQDRAEFENAFMNNPQYRQGLEKYYNPQVTVVEEPISQPTPTQTSVPSTTQSPRQSTTSRASRPTPVETARQSQSNFGNNLLQSLAMNKMRLDMEQTNRKKGIKKPDNSLVEGGLDAMYEARDSRPLMSKKRGGKLPKYTLGTNDILKKTLTPQYNLNYNIGYNAANKGIPTRPDYSLGMTNMATNPALDRVGNQLSNVSGNNTNPTGTNWGNIATGVQAATRLGAALFTPKPKPLPTVSYNRLSTTSPVFEGARRSAGAGFRTAMGVSPQAAYAQYLDATSNIAGQEADYRSQREAMNEQMRQETQMRNLDIMARNQQARDADTAARVGLVAEAVDIPVMKKAQDEASKQQSILGLYRAAAAIENEAQRQEYLRSGLEQLNNVNRKYGGKLKKPTKGYLKRKFKG